MNHPLIYFWRWESPLHIKFVVNPPAMIKMKTGLLLNKVGAPSSIACSAMGFPAAIPKAKQALITPAKKATQSPAFKN